MAAAFLFLIPALARSAEPDILTGPVPGPCTPQAADYVDGVDATGNPVTPAGGPGSNSQMGDGTVVLNVHRQHGRDVSVPVHLADLAPPACASPPHRSPR
ncbi:MAG TPA: hypothetical protein VII56_21125 [Rhizomicrobium sp.]